jgi:hypothetical protein
MGRIFIVWIKADQTSGQGCRWPSYSLRMDAVRSEPQQCDGADHKSGVRRFYNGESPLVSPRWNLTGEERGRAKFIEKDGVKFTRGSCRLGGVVGADADPPPTT